MGIVNNVTHSPIKDKLGKLSYSSGYQYRDFYYKNDKGQKIHVVGWHRAIDIITLGTIVAFQTGKVVAITKGITGQTTNPSGGNSVTLEHGDGCKTIYCHLDNKSNNHLKIGDIVKIGEKLGTDIIKTTGNSTGLHLHFAIYNPKEVYEKSHYVNPIPYLQGTKVLKPYGDSPSPEPTPKPTEKFKVGDYVVPTKLVDYKGTHLKQYDKKYQILQIDKRGNVLGAVRGNKRPIWAVLPDENIKKA